MTSKGPRLLLTQREGAVLLERARIFVDGGRLVYSQVQDTNEKVFNIPHANLAIMFLGQGTSMTSDAARMLSEEGVFVAFTGSGGSPLHYGALTTYQGPERMRRWFRVSDNAGASLAASKCIMHARIDAVCAFGADLAEDFVPRIKRADLKNTAASFAKAIISAQSSTELMGAEGRFAKQLYSLFASAARLTDFARRPGESNLSTAEGRANARIDQGNYIAYGIAGAVLWTLGIPSGLSVLHGKTRAGGLVFDLADSFKDALILPLAFHDHSDEQSFRQEVINAIQDIELFKRCFVIADDMLSNGEHVFQQGATA